MRTCQVLTVMAPLEVRDMVFESLRKAIIFVWCQNAAQKGFLHLGGKLN